MNKVRGEQKLTIGQKEYLFRPENRALAAIEGSLDVGLLELAQRFLNAKQRQTDIATVLHECSRAAADPKAGYDVLPYNAAFDYAMECPREANKVAMALVLERYGPAEGSGEAGKAEATGS
jgi:hypothetical protein